MNRNEAIAVLKQSADAISGLGATALYLYGSTAADQAGKSSDIDLFVDYDPNSRFNAFNLVEMKLLLEDRMRIPVDLTTRDGLHPRLRAGIEQQAIRVF